ncbi:MAG: methyltransferase domain-containing protein [Planctomycetota bacterium]|jgi:hypothetical protein
MTKNEKRVPASFRDPSGFLFIRDGILYRRVNKSYKDNYDLLRGSGLYEDLAGGNLLIPHEEVEADFPLADEAYRLIRPEKVPFISYPYEWCFSQLRDAALATLEIQKRALEREMSLKDASAYNIQFLRGRPVLIDTLSFEEYEEGRPWVAYRQFCQHFVAPLVLMSYKDVRLGQLLRVHIDGIPLDLASSLLPARTRFRFSILSHIHLHAGFQKKYADKAVDTSAKKMSRFALRGLIDNLESLIRKLKWKPAGTEWAEYYTDTNYTEAAAKHKKELVSEFVETGKPKTVWDLGANTGVFSRIAAEKGAGVISFDVDPAAVELNYLECVKNGEKNILPLLLDLSNPSPDIGWANEERRSLAGRGPADAVLALALVHHLAISNNVPLEYISAYLRKCCSSLLMEFVPKTDSQIQRMLATRDDIFENYSRETFENSFRTHWEIGKSVPVKESERTIYFMTAK